MSTSNEKTQICDDSSSKSVAEVAVVYRGNDTDSSSEDGYPKTWRSYIWDTLDKPKEERRFLLKLDSVILTFACLGYFIKNLNQININNAYVSGMKEDLNMYGNELNYMQTLWTVGYVIGEVPRYVNDLVMEAMSYVLC